MVISRPSRLSPLNSPLFIGDLDVEQHDLVIHFDGGCFKELQIGGAGVVISKHIAGSLTLLDTVCIPIYPCPDAAYAEPAELGTLSSLLLNTSRKFSQGVS